MLIGRLNNNRLWIRMSVEISRWADCSPAKPAALGRDDDSARKARRARHARASGVPFRSRAGVRTSRLARSSGRSAPSVSSGGPPSEISNRAVPTPGGSVAASIVDHDERPYGHQPRGGMGFHAGASPAPDPHPRPRVPATAGRTRPLDAPTCTTEGVTLPGPRAI